MRKKVKDLVLMGLGYLLSVGYPIGVIIALVYVDATGKSELQDATYVAGFLAIPAILTGSALLTLRKVGRYAKTP